MRTTTRSSPLPTSRIIAAGLIAGVTVFALVAWVIVHERGPMAADASLGGLMVSAWAAIAAVTIVAAVVIWRLRVAPLLETRRAPGALGATPADPTAARDESLQSGVLTVWALLESSALFGVALYLLFGTTLSYAAGLLLVWLGIGLTFPRAAWYATR